MHASPFFLRDVAGFLGGYYAFIAAMNGVFALILWRRRGQGGWAVTWAAFAGVMMVLASLALSGSSRLVPALPDGVRAVVNTLSGPVLYTVGTLALFTVLYVFRRFFVQPMVAWTILNAALVLMGQIVGTADIKQSPHQHPVGAGLRATCDGLGWRYPDDDERILREGFVVYDALYTWCQRQVQLGRT